MFLSFENNRNLEIIGVIRIFIIRQKLGTANYYSAHFASKNIIFIFSIIRYFFLTEFPLDYFKNKILLAYNIFVNFINISILFNSTPSNCQRVQTNFLIFYSRVSITKCIRLSGKCLSFTDTSFTTIHLYTNMKSNLLNIMIFILIEQNGSYAITTK